MVHGPEYSYAASIFKKEGHRFGLRVSVRFFEFAMPCVRWEHRGGNIRLNVSDLLCRAPVHVIASIAYLVFEEICGVRDLRESAMHRRVVKWFAASPTFVRQTSDTAVGRVTEGRTEKDDGRLAEAYDALAEAGLVDAEMRPHLMWMTSQRSSYADPNYRIVAVGRRYASASGLVLAYILYRMLCGARMCITPAPPGVPPLARFAGWEEYEKEVAETFGKVRC